MTRLCLRRCCQPPGDPVSSGCLVFSHTVGTPTNLQPVGLVELVLPLDRASLLMVGQGVAPRLYSGS